MPRAAQSPTAASIPTRTGQGDEPGRDERAGDAPASLGQVVVLTGLSGSGKSQASKLLMLPITAESAMI